MAKTTCPPRDDLSDYLFGRLGEPAASQIAVHLETCAECDTIATQLEAEGGGDTLVDGLRMPQPAAWLGADVADQDRPDEQVVPPAVAQPGAAGTPDTERGDAPSPPLWRLGEYEVIGEELGQGGLGSVYQARHTKLDRLAAIKVLKANRTANPEAVARFALEMKAVARLDHPSIVKAYDAREIDGRHFLVMEYVDGSDLDSILLRRGPLGIADCCELARQAALGLHYAHQRGLIHRDVKPSNLMLTREGVLKILDFGTALLGDRMSEACEITSAGWFVGTPAYVSPEQATNSHAVDVRTDLYSLGCTLYRLLTGAPPFAGPGYNTPYLQVTAHREQPVPSVRERRPDVPRKMAAIVDRLLAKDPSQRFATAAEVAEALRPFCKGADLPALLVSTMTGSPWVEFAKPEHRDSASRLGDSHSAQAASEHRRPSWVAVAAAAALFSIIALGVIIRIRYRDGRETVIHAPQDTQVVVEHEADSATAATAQLAADSAAPSAKSSTPAEAGPPAVTVGKPLPPPPLVPLVISPERPATEIGQPLSSEALVQQPARIPGVRSWTIETRGPRLGSSVTSILKVSPDGTLLASGGMDGSVRLWEMATGRLVRVFVGANDYISTMAWSPDGKTLAVCAGNQVSLWDALRGQRTQLLQSDFPLSSIAWSPDGQRLATSHATGRREVHIWDVNSGSVQKSLHVPEVAGIGTCGLAWLPDGGRLLVGCFSSIELWDIESDKSLHSVAASYQLNWLSLTSDGTQVLILGPTGKSQLWRMESDRLVGPQEMATGLPAPTAFSLVGGLEDAVWSVFNSNEGIVRGNPSTGNATRVTKESLDPVALSTRDGRWIAYEAGGAIGVVDAASGQIVWSVAGHAPQAGAMSWSPDGKALAIEFGYLHARLQLFSTASGQSEWQPDDVCGCNGPRSIAWSPGGDTLFRACQDRFRVWDYPSKSLLGMFPTPISADTMALSPDGKILVTNATGAGGELGLNQGRVRLWEVSSRKELGELALSNSQLWPLSVEFSADGSLLAVGTILPDGSGGLELLAVESGKVLWAITPGTGATPLAFSPDGKLLASPGSIYDAETGERLTDFRGQENPTTVRWLSDGKTIATGAGDRTLRFWDAATGVSQRVVPAPMCAVLSPDESLAAGVCVRWRNPGTSRTESTGTVQISDTRTGRLLRSIVGLRDGKYLTLAPDGHYVGSPKIERDIVYVVETDAGQETLTPEEFSQRFNWQNDPAQLQLSQ